MAGHSGNRPGDKPGNEPPSALGAVGLIARGLLTILLLCVLVGGGVCGICIGIMDLKGPHANPREGVALIVYTLLGIAFIGLLLWLMWRRRVPAGPRPGPERPSPPEQ